MVRQRSTWLVAALVAGGLMAGCGSSSNSTSSTQSTSVSVTKTTAPASTSSTPANAATSPSVPITVPGGVAGVNEAIAICKSVIQREPTLSTSVKSKVEGICNKAAHGNLAAARAASKEVCREVIDASPIPGAAKQEALAACQRG